MGTSASKGDPAPGFPLVPPWANQDSVVPPDETEAPGDANHETDADQSEEEQSPPPAPSPPAPTTPFRKFRGKLKRYVDTGDRDDARSAIGNWVNTSRGGARFATQRLSRAIRSGGAAFAALSRAVAGAAPVAGELDVRTLAGLSADVVINRIVDAYCPPGILDEDALRAALGEALAEVLAGADTFDPAAVDENAVRIAMLRFVAELVFVSVMLDSGDSFAGAAPTIAIQRENDLRALIREVTDVVGSPLLAAAGAALSETGVREVISRVVLAVNADMATWE
jgi:hypothetical protein